MIKIAFKKKGVGFLGVLSSWLIRGWTLGRYSHCEMIDTEGNEDSKDWVAYTATALQHGGGVACVKGSEYPIDYWDVFDIEDVGDEQAIVTFLKLQVSKKYDWVGIFLSMFFNAEQHEPGRWFCSELCAGALKMAGYLNTPRKPQAFHPNNLKEILLYDKVILPVNKG